LLVIHWSSIVMGSVSEMMQVFVARYRRICVVFAVFSTLTLYPAALAKTLTRPDPIWGSVYNAFNGLYAIVLIFGSSYFGFRLYRVISTVANRTVPFLKRLLIMIGIVDFALVGHLIILVFFFVETSREPFRYITLHIILRLLEGSLALSIIIFLWRPAGQSTTSHSFSSHSKTQPVSGMQNELQLSQSQRYIDAPKSHESQTKENTNSSEEKRKTNTNTETKNIENQDTGVSGERNEEDDRQKPEQNNDEEYKNSEPVSINIEQN
jgi:glucan phosphoethanolaminetransferase (alkaline phosphatase superfamily)